MTVSQCCGSFIMQHESASSIHYILSLTQPPSPAHLHATPPGDHRARSWRLPRYTAASQQSSILHTVVCTRPCYCLNPSHAPFSLCVYKPKSSIFTILLFQGRPMCSPSYGLSICERDLETSQHKKKQNKTKRAETILVFLKKVKVFNIQ